MTTTPTFLLPLLPRLPRLPRPFLPSRPTPLSPPRPRPPQTSASTNPPTIHIDISIPHLQTPSTFPTHIQTDATHLITTLLPHKSIELSIMFVSDKHMAQLNSQWRGLDQPTDVLSFPQQPAVQHQPQIQHHPHVLGDLVVSLETAATQAAARRLSLRDEVRLLMVHGVLHLMGYDHVGLVEGDWLVMARMEKTLIDQLRWKGQGLIADAEHSSVA